MGNDISAEERYQIACGIYELGLRRVLTEPEPEGQKFPIGARVRIAKDLGSFMMCFISDKDATVEYTYAHAYGGNNVRDYSLNIDGEGSYSWYHEEQLTLIAETKKGVE